MRIIGGTHGGLKLQIPAGLPVRPTTDRAKESLFNILENRFHLPGMAVLDLFAGTGNLSAEFASRGCSVTSIDEHQACVRFMKQTAATHFPANWSVYKASLPAYLNTLPPSQPFHLVFADPPYAWPQLTTLPGLVLGKSWLQPGGLLVLEHATRTVFAHPPNEQRIYGQSCFSFFQI